MPAVAARQLAPEGRDPGRSEAQAGPRVLLAMAHPTMRALTSELLRSEGGCCVRGVTGHDEAIADALDQELPDLVVLDAAQFPGCCPETLRRFPTGRTIVIGPELGDPYRVAAVAAGAGGWVARERIADDLIAEVWRVLGVGTPSRSLKSDPVAEVESSVIDRNSSPRRARMPGPAAPATLIATVTRPPPEEP